MCSKERQPSFPVIFAFIDVTARAPPTPETYAKYQCQTRCPQTRLGAGNVVRCRSRYSQFRHWYTWLRLSTPSSDSGTPSSVSGAFSSVSGTPGSQSGTPSSESGIPSSESGIPSSVFGTPSTVSGTPLQSLVHPVHNLVWAT